VWSEKVEEVEKASFVFSQLCMSSPTSRTHITQSSSEFRQGMQNLGDLSPLIPADVEDLESLSDRKIHGDRPCEERGEGLDECPPV